MNDMDFFGSLVKPGALLLTRVTDFLTEQDIPSYIVGGFVRDVLLGRETADIDIVVGTDALQIAPRIAAALGGKSILLDRVNRVARVVLADKEATSINAPWQLDFATLEGNIEQNLAQRDFTVDAMAIRLSPPGKSHTESQLIDPFHGLDDLHHGVIRAVSEAAFQSDAARLLRAVRLAAELEFSIDQKTEALIQHHAHLITDVAGERVREELLRLLAIPRTEQLLPFLDRLGLLTALIPELAQAKGAEQPREHFWNVFDHTIRTAIAVDFLLRQGTWEYAEGVLAGVPWSAALAEHFDLEVGNGSTRRSLLKLAALLHDIAKPQTKTVDDDGRIRFLGHPQEGATIASGILERLRFSNKEIKLVEIIVRHHLRPVQMSYDALPSSKAIYRYFRDTGETGIDILFFSLADHLATRGPHLNTAHWQNHVNIVEYVLAQRFQKENVVVPPKLIDGHDLINIFAISPGPEIGELLEAVREAQAAEELTTREEALAYIRQRLLSKAV